MRTRHPSMISSILFMVLVIELVFPLLLYLGRNRVMFHPLAEPSPETASELLGDSAIVRITRPDDRALSAFDVGPSTPLSASCLPVVLFFHGNGGNIATRASLIAQFAELTASRVLMIDYSGYGGNPGSPSESEVVTDGLAAYDHLADQGVGADRIVIYGESLGGAVAVAIASERPAAGLVLQSSFASVSSMALRLYPWMPLVGILSRGSFDSGARIGSLDLPILVAHGSEDRIVPFEEGQKLHRLAAGSELVVIEGAGHNNFLARAGLEYLEGLGERFHRWTSCT